MTRLYKRNARLTLAKPSGFFEQDIANAIQIEDLRVAFTIDKSLRRQPNQCRVSVYNLSQTTRTALQTKPLYARLDFGYDGQYERMFAGDVFFVRSLRRGPDWETEMQVADGMRAMRFARVSRSYGSGVDAYSALREAADSMGLTLKTSRDVRNGLRAQYSAGLVLDGNAADVVSKTLAPYGMSWSIQDGRLQILLPDEIRTDSTEILISQDTGMIGSPEFNDPPKKGARPTLRVESLLYPELAPGGRVRVESKTATGLFKILKVRHSGDTHGPEATTEIECRTT